MTVLAADAPRSRIKSPAGNRPRLILVACQATHVAELLRLARFMEERGSFDIGFCLHRLERGGTRRFASIIAEAGFTALDLAAPARPHNGLAGLMRRTCQHLRNGLMPIGGYRRRRELVELENARSSHFAGVSFWEKLKVQAALFGAYFPLHVAVVVLRRLADATALLAIFRASRDLYQIRRFLVERQVSLLVFCEDNVEMATPLWIRAARELAVPSVVVPYTIANALEPYESYRNQRRHRVRPRPLNMIAAWAFPKWQAHYKGSHFLRTTGDRIIALELLGCAPPNPWIMNSGYATAIAAESPAMVAYDREAGLPAEQLILTGSLADDVIHAARRRRATAREELTRNFGLEPDWPILVCAFPPNQLASRPHPGFADFRALSRGYLASLNKVERWNIVIRLHPRVSPSDLDSTALGRAVICDWDTASLVALCDLYVATVSATIRWAIACGTPVVNYDVYDYRYSDYAALEAVFTTPDRHAFETELLRLTEDPAALERARQRQAKTAPKWGLLDGRSGQRIAELFEQLVAAPKQGTPPCRTVRSRVRGYLPAGLQSRQNFFI